MQTASQSFQRHSFLISLLFIMAIYLPVNYFSFVNMDDIGLVQRLHDNYSTVDFLGLFVQNSTTKYYRPLLEILYYLDYAAWGMSINGYHFTNFLIHILNACLVYAITRHLFKSESNSKRYAVMAMVFFALNPLACESVAWISGRSDLAGTFFSLLAVNFYFLKTPLRFVLTPLSIFLGLLCKENALAVIPILVVMEGFLNNKRQTGKGAAIKGCLIWGSVVLVPLLCYLFLRTNGWEHYTYNYVEVTLPLGSKHLGQGRIDIIGLLYVFPVIAFYFKKLVLPFPLNFAISQINTFFYSLLFSALFFLNIFWCVKKKRACVVFCILLFVSFAPALPVALGGVAWVPLAERYLYLSLGVFSVGLVSFLKHLVEKGGLSGRQISIFCMGIVLILSGSTVNRMFVWKDSQSLWADTLRKNPENSMVLFKYAQAFGGKEAQWAYQKAVANSENFKWKTMALLKIAAYERSVGNNDRAMATLEKALEGTPSFDTYCQAAEIVLGMETCDTQKKQGVIEKAIEYYGFAHAQKKTAFVLYRIGILLKKIDKIDEANTLFRQLVEKYPDSKYAFHLKDRGGNTTKPSDVQN